MKRRQTLLAIVGLGAGLSAMLDSAAQRGATAPVIGLLDAGERLSWWAAFRQQMAKLGYVEGKNVTYAPRYAASRLDRLDAMARELVRLEAAVIVAAATVATQAAKRATDRIPIVTATGTDHVSMGFAASLARPGGNVTGMASISSELTAKRLELLREILPKLSRLAVLWQSDNPGSAAAFRELEHATRVSKIALQNVGVRKREDIVGAFSAVTRERAEALFVIGGPLTIDERPQIAQLALKHRVPTMSTGSDSVELGGLVSYGPSIPDLFRRAAVYVDKILKGAKPGDLPIEQPIKFELTVNRKTAKALGIAVPQAVLLRADRVID